MTINYKNTTLVLMAFLSTLLLAVTAVGITIHNKKTVFTKSVKWALNLNSARGYQNTHATRDFSRLGVSNNLKTPNLHEKPKALNHVPLRAFGAHRDALLLCETPYLSTTTHPFSLPSAKFAAEVITKLEVPAATGTSPQPFRATMQVLAVLSGKSKNKNETIGWVTQIDDPQRADVVQIWVAFRGTQTKAEWKQDFRVKQVPMVARHQQTTRLTTPSLSPFNAHLTLAPPNPESYAAKDMLVHQGFYEAYQDIQQHLVDTLMLHFKSTTKKTDLYLSGHSLGAAVAELALADILILSPDLSDLIINVKCYLFGAPRVGNHTFVDSVLQQCRLHAAPSFRSGHPLAPFHDLVPPRPVNLGVDPWRSDAPVTTTTTTSIPKVSEFVIFVNDDDIVPNIPLAVQPNFGDPNHPWIYAQFPVLRFSANWGNWTENHTLPIHIDYLNKL